MKSLRRLLVAKDGTVAVETALVVSLFLAPMLLCLWDFAQIYLGQADVDEAVQDAMTYVMSAVSARTTPTTAGAQTAAQAASGTTIAVSSSTVCYCVSTTTTVPTMPTSVSCTGSCQSGLDFQQFMSIATSKSITIPLPISWIDLTSPFTVKSTGLVRTG